MPSTQHPAVEVAILISSRFRAAPRHAGAGMICPSNSPAAALDTPEALRLEMIWLDARAAAAAAAGISGRRYRDRLASPDAAYALSRLARRCPISGRRFSSKIFGDGVGEISHGTRCKARLIRRPAYTSSFRTRGFYALCRRRWR